MELSDDLFAEIRNALGLGENEATAASSPSSAPVGGRRAGRMDAAQAGVEMELPGTLLRRRVIRLLDVGRRGVSFLDNRTWGAGETFVVHLPRSPEHMIPFLCIVRNSRLVDGRFRIGAEFVTQDEAPSMMVIRDVDGIVAAARPAEPAADTDAGRRAPRKRFPRASARAQLHTYERETPGPILEADVVDLSEGGVGLLCAGALPPGRKLIIRLCPPGERTITRMCEVVTCRANDAGGYRVGTRFIEYKRGRSLPQALFGWLRG